MNFCHKLLQYCMPIFMLGGVTNVYGQEWENIQAIQAIFTENSVTGTFVLYHPEKNIFYGSNQKRAKTAYQPASTFKILNSLIAFETGVVKDETEILPYGGKPQPFKEWEHDMNIQEAIAVSNVPIYQGIARHIGLERMQLFIEKSNYGNQNIGQQIDNFWLVGPLKITAIEQTQFLQKLLQHDLPFSEGSIQHLKNIMPSEQSKQGKVFFKTGWANNTVKPDTGWLVGWVEYQGKNYPFALNIDIYQESDTKKRLLIAQTALHVLGLF